MVEIAVHGSLLDNDHVMITARLTRLDLLASGRGQPAVDAIVADLADSVARHLAPAGREPLPGETPLFDVEGTCEEEPPPVLTDGRKDE